MIKRLSAPVLLLALAGCAQNTQPLNVIDASMIGPVLSSIKREVGIYLMYQNNPPRTLVQPAAIVAFARPAAASPASRAIIATVPLAAAATKWMGCAGDAAPSFVIQSVKINFAISQDATATGGVSATIPLAITGTSFGLGGAASSDKADAKTLEFTEYPDTSLMRTTRIRARALRGNWRWLSFHYAKVCWRRQRTALASPI